MELEALYQVINGKQISERIEKLSEIGKTSDQGVDRRALTKEDKQAQELTIKWMEEAGLTVRHDHFGNLIGRKEGNNPNLPVVMIGSHIDSVRNGGRYDGIIGVLAGIEIVQVIHDNRIYHDHPIEVVAFCEEEGSRFNDGLFGSRGMIGKIDQDNLSIKDENGISRYQALKEFGYGINPDLIDDSIRKNGELKLFAEMHIEQGPYLEANGHSVGIVKGIAGPSWFKIKVSGEAGHAGTVPMNLRKDPLLGTAEIITEIEKIVKYDPKAATVGTIGRIYANPGGVNIIPDSVEFTIDLRDIDLERRTQVASQCEAVIEAICQKRKLTFDIDKNMDIKPVHCSDGLIESFKEASKKVGLEAPVMISGAGHDAMLLADITDIGMVFVRCRKGISHQPEEYATESDIVDGTKLMLEVILEHI